MGEIWGIAVAVGGSILGGLAQGQQQQQTMQQQNKYTQQDQELNFQRQAWLAQQQRLWQLQDRKYKQQAVAGFKGYWNAGGNVTPPNQDAEMNSLDQFDPNKLGSVGAIGNTTAQPPLAQLGGTGIGQANKVPGNV